MPARKEAQLKRLHEEGQKTLGIFGALTEAQRAQTVYASGPRWTAHDMLAHMLLAERLFNYYNRDVIAGGPGLAEGFDIDGFNAEHTPEGKEIAYAALLEQFAAVRAETIQVVETMADADFDRTAWHPFLGHTTLEQILKIIYRHNMLHQRDLQKVLETGQPIPGAH